MQADVELTRAVLLVRIGCSFLTRDRGLALREIFAAIRRCPRVTPHVPWRRVATLLLADPVRRLVSRTQAD